MYGKELRELRHEASQQRLVVIKIDSFCPVPSGREEIDHVSTLVEQSADVDTFVAEGLDSIAGSHQVQSTQITPSTPHHLRLDTRVTHQSRHAFLGGRDQTEKMVTQRHRQNEENEQRHKQGTPAIGAKDHTRDDCKAAMRNVVRPRSPVPFKIQMSPTQPIPEPVKLRK